VLVSVLAACSSTPEEVIVITATPVPATSTPAPTDTPQPTPTHKPSATPSPEPTIPPVSIDDIEVVLGNNGYSRYPFENEGTAGFYWIKGNAYEDVTTWDYGAIELEVLHDGSSGTRASHMEQKFQVLDEVFSQDFMANLRREFDEYNLRVPADISGDPDRVYSLGGEFKDVWAQYFLEEYEISGYFVSFSVWWWQSTCPAGYICWYPNFPGLEFEGDSSFKFLNVHIESIYEAQLGGSS
jgi:hypothetical protein